MVEIFIILLVVSFFYAKTLSYLLVVDDMSRYKDYPVKGLEPSIKASGFIGWIRWWWYGFGTLGVDRTSEKTLRASIKKDHALTTVLHALTCVLIYLALGKNAVSFGAAILFAVNPSNHQTAIWANGRRYVICIILTLIMLLIPKPWGIAVWALTPIFQITAIFAPILLGWQYAPLSILALLGAWMMMKGEYKVRIGTQGSDEMRRWSLGRAVVSIKLYGFYFIRSIFPGRVMMVYPHLYFWGLTKAGTDDAHKLNLNFVRGCSAVTLTVTGILLLGGHERLYLLFASLAMLQWCGFAVVNQHSCDRYVGVANVFMMYLVSYLAQTYVGVYAYPFLAFMAGLYISELNTIMPMYKSIISFHDYHNHFYPENIISRQSHIHGLMSGSRPLEAWFQVQAALQYNPTDTRINFLAAQICYTMGDFGRAKAHLAVAREHVYLGQAKFYEPQFAQLEANCEPKRDRFGNKYTPKLRTPPKRFADV